MNQILEAFFMWLEDRSWTFHKYRRNKRQALINQRRKELAEGIGKELTHELERLIKTYATRLYYSGVTLWLYVDGKFQTTLAPPHIYQMPNSHTYTYFRSEVINGKLVVKLCEVGKPSTIDYPYDKQKCEDDFIHLMNVSKMIGSSEILCK